MHARAFESYVIGKLQDQSISNDYLANVVDGQVWQMQAEISGLGDSYPYLRDAELEIVRPAFDALFETIQSRKTDQGVELYKRDMSERPVVAGLTGNELGEWSDMRDLGRKAQQWYRENLVGTEPVTNIETGWKISFDATGARKIGGRKGDILYRLVPAIPDIVKKGDLISTEPDRLGRDEVQAVHKISARVSMGETEYSVIATVREKADGTYHYDLSMDRGAEVDSRSADREVEARAVDRGARGFSTPTAQDKSRASALEGGPANLNLSIDGGEINAVPTSILADIVETVRQIIKAHGLGSLFRPASCAACCRPRACRC